MYNEWFKSWSTRDEINSFVNSFINIVLLILTMMVCNWGGLLLMSELDRQR